MHEPNHVRQFQDADPLAVSGYVAQAAKRALTSRAPPDAYLAADLYQILITPRSGESYQPETLWPVMCSKRQTLDHLMDEVFADCSARVISARPKARPRTYQKTLQGFMSALCTKAEPTCRRYWKSSLSAGT